MHLALVANRKSGSGRVDLDEVEALLASGGANDIRAIELADLDTTELEGIDRLVVAGGDGTIAGAAACAVRSRCDLAVVPAGTANDFARALQIPLDPGAAAAMAADPGARTRTAELARAGEVPYVNAAACGLTVTAAERAGRLKRALGPLAYGVGAVNAGLNAHTITARVVVDGEVLHHGAAWQVMIAASGAFGGGATLGPVDADDGRLDVAVIPTGSRVGLVGRAWGMRTGTLYEQSGIKYGRGREVLVEGPRDFNVDGELLELDRALFRVDGTVPVVVGTTGGSTHAAR